MSEAAPSITKSRDSTDAADASKPRVDPGEWARKRREALEKTQTARISTASTDSAQPSSVSRPTPVIPVAQRPATTVKTSPRVHPKKRDISPLHKRNNSESLLPIANEAASTTVAFQIGRAHDGPAAPSREDGEHVHFRAQARADKADHMHHSTLQEPATDAPFILSNVKRVLLIRHAESEENVVIMKSKRAIEGLARGKFPSLDELSGIHAVLSQSHLDSKLSEDGVKEAENMRQIIAGGETNFWNQFRPSIFFTSPLIRARTTCATILGSRTERIVVEERLREASHYEAKINSTQLDVRIKEFEGILRKVDVNNVVVFGHSLYFRRLLKSEGVMRNVDVVEVTATFSDNGDCVWGEPKLLFRTLLAKKHPNYADMFPLEDAEDTVDAQSKDMEDQASDARIAAFE